MLAVFAPAAPALGETVIAAGLFLAWVVAFGLLWVYRSTLGAIALGLADRIEDVGIPTGIRRIHPFGPLADGIRWVDGEIDDGLAWAVKNTQRGAAILFQLVTRQLRAIGDQVGGLAYDVSERFHHVSTHEIPALVGIAVKPVRISLDKTRTLAHATAGTIAHDIPALRREVADWKGYTRRMLRRLRRMEKLLAPTAFAAAVAVALTKLGMGWLKCPALTRIGKRHGCAPWRLLELLLATTVPALVLGNVCQLVKYAEAGAVAVEPSLSALVATGENFVCGGDTDGPSGIIAADRHDSTTRPSGWLAADLVGSSV